MLSPPRLFVEAYGSSPGHGRRQEPPRVVVERPAVGAGAARRGRWVDGHSQVELGLVAGAAGAGRQAVATLRFVGRDREIMLLFS